MTQPKMSRSEALAMCTAVGEACELATVEINGTPQRVFANGPSSLRVMYERAVTDAPFIVYEDERMTFREAWQATAETAAMLVANYGIEPGDRVAISMRNYPEWMTAFAAITSIGAIAVAMNAMWNTDEMEYGLRDCGAKVLIADEERVARCAAMADRESVAIIAVRPRTDRADVPELSALVEPFRGAAMPEASIGADDAASMFYTSGSTGYPKGVLSTHRNIISALMSWELDARVGRRVNAIPPIRPDGQAAALLGIPLFHVTGSHAVFLQSYRAQRKLVAMYKWDPEVAAEIIERERITTFMAPPALTGDLVRVARSTNRDLSSLIAVGGGGAARAPEQVEQIGKSFGRALPNTGWGMTETNAIGAGISEHDYLSRPASSGRCSAVLELRIIDEDGAPLPAGQRGELLVRGTSIFREYWNRPEANADSFIDGWFRTGDVAYLDDEGFLFIVDRIKDLIIRGGENIGTGAVEAALLQHPMVHEAAVYSVPDDRLGEEVGATVHADPGLDADTLREFVRPLLAVFAVPKYLTLLPEPLPRTASGKIFKRELREHAIAQL